MVSRLGGFIAKNDNSVSLGSGSNYAPGVSISEEEAAAFLKTIDCSVPGSRRMNTRFNCCRGLAPAVRRFRNGEGVKFEERRRLHVRFC